MNMKPYITAFIVIICMLTLPALFAYEAHTVNVTARIENPLIVSPSYIDADLSKEGISEIFTISLSDSFKAQERFGQLNYRVGIELKSLDGSMDTDSASSLLVCERSSEENLEPPDDLGAASLDRSINDISDTWTISTAESVSTSESSAVPESSEILLSSGTTASTSVTESAGLTESTGVTESASTEETVAEEISPTPKRYRIYLKAEIISYSRLAKKGGEE